MSAGGELLPHSIPNCLTITIIQVTQTENRDPLRERQNLVQRWKSDFVLADFDASRSQVSERPNSRRSVQSSAWKASNGGSGKTTFLCNVICRRSKKEYGIWDLTQKTLKKAKIMPLRQNWDFFGTIFELSGTLSLFS